MLPVKFRIAATVGTAIVALSAGCSSTEPVASAPTVTVTVTAPSTGTSSPGTSSPANQVTSLDVPIELRPVVAFYALGAEGGGVPTPPVEALEDSDEDVEYWLEPAALVLEDLQSLEVEDHALADVGVVWGIDLQVLAEDAPVLEALTRELFGLSPPQNQMAIIVGGEILSVPVVQGVVTDGVLHVSGDFTEAEAHALVERLRHGSA